MHGSTTPTRPAPTDNPITDQPSRNEARTLTDLQATRLDYARRELESARAADLSQLSPSGLIFLITQLTHRLDDALAVTAEVFGHPQPDEPEPPRNHH